MRVVITLEDLKIFLIPQHRRRLNLPRSLYYEFVYLNFDEICVYLYTSNDGKLWFSLEGNYNNNDGKDMLRRKVDPRELEEPRDMRENNISISLHSAEQSRRFLADIINQDSTVMQDYVPLPVSTTTEFVVGSSSDDEDDDTESTEPSTSSVTFSVPPPQISQPPPMSHPLSLTLHVEDLNPTVAQNLPTRRRMVPLP